jgi:peptide-methionine (S)-S-oxide reductase
MRPLSAVLIHGGENMAVIYLGGGCYWKIQNRFDRYKGVSKTEVGMMVESENDIGIEVVRIDFDEESVTLDNLIQWFLKSHNPSSRYRQGMDIGFRYESVIFCIDEQQMHAVGGIIEEAKQRKTIVTQIRKMARFVSADESEQHYYKKKGILFNDDA